MEAWNVLALQLAYENANEDCKRGLQLIRNLPRTNIAVKVESEKVGLKLNIQKMKIMASGPITSWQIDGETVETVTTLFSWAPKSLQMMTAAMMLKDALSLEDKL